MAECTTIYNIQNKATQQQHNWIWYVASAPIVVCLCICAKCTWHDMVVNGMSVGIALVMSGALVAVSELWPPNPPFPSLPFPVSVSSPFILFSFSFGKKRTSQ